MNMNKIKMSLVYILLLVFMFFSFTEMSLANSNIVDSIEFTGSTVNLSLDDAQNMIVKNNSDVIKKGLQIEKVKLNASSLTETINTAEGRYSDSRTLNYMENVTINKLDRDFTIDNAQRNYDATVIKLKADIHEAYYSELQAEDQVKINTDNLNVAKDTYNITKNKFDLGLVSKQDLFSSEENKIKAQTDLNSSIIALKSDKMSLNLKLGNDLMTNIKLTDTLKYEEYKLGSIAEAVQKAIDNRNEIKSSQYQYQKQEVTTAIEFAKGSKYSTAYQNAVFTLDQDKKDMEYTCKSIELEVRNNYLDVMQKQDAILSYQKQIDINQDSLKAAQFSYEKGLSTLNDLQKVQVDLQQSKLKLSKAILDYMVSVLKYQDSLTVGRTSLN